MSPLLLTFLMFGLGIVLLLGEVLLPTHGVLGVLSLIAFGVAIGACFYIDQYLGLAVFLGAVIVSPFIGGWFVKLYPRTPIGRRMVLQPVESHLKAPPVKIGQTGVAMSELRPMGEAEFADLRLEVISEYGMIEPGRRIRVVGFANGKPTVRAVKEASSGSVQES